MVHCKTGISVTRKQNYHMREGEKIIGIYTGQDDVGAITFFAKKMNGWRLFSKKKMTGRTLFSTKKMTGQRLFCQNSQAHFFLLLMLSCLTLDGECFICLNIAQFYYLLLLRIVIIFYGWFEGCFWLNLNEAVNTFFDRKNDGADTFFGEKNDGAWTISWKNKGAKTFFEEQKFLLPSTCFHNFCFLP